MDKRYDAIYQRGHAGAQPSTAAADQTGAHRTQPGGAGERANGAFAGRADAAEEREQRAPAGDSGGVEVAPLDGDGRPLAESLPEPAAARPPANPYLRLLVIVGAILVVGGAAALLWGGQLMSMRMMPTGVDDQNQAILMFTYGQAMITLGPFLLALGIGTLIGVMFLSAAQWRTANRPLKRG